MSRTGLSTLLLGLLALAVAAIAPLRPAAAHDKGTTGFAEIVVHGQTVRYSLTLGSDTLAAAGVELPPSGRVGAPDDMLVGLLTRYVGVSAEGRACAPVPGTVTPPPAGQGNVVVTVDFACAAPVRRLQLRDDLSERFGADYHTLANIVWPGGRAQLVFQPDRREAGIETAGPADAAAMSGEASGLAYLGLGFDHILLGFDHLLFVLALILGGGRLRELLVTVTAFTLAHSITLALSVLDILVLPAGLVEPAIALSIAYVAFENIFLARAVSRRWAVAFLFGLVHGAGFAGALRELGLPADDILWPLVGFNLGVEAGQAVVVAILLPLLLWLRRFAWERRASVAASALVLAAGLALLGERALVPGG